MEQVRDHWFSCVPASGAPVKCERGAPWLGRSDPWRLWRLGQARAPGPSGSGARGGGTRSITTELIVLQLHRHTTSLTADDPSPPVRPPPYAYLYPITQPQPHWGRLDVKSTRPNLDSLPPSASAQSHCHGLRRATHGPGGPESRRVSKLNSWPCSSSSSPSLPSISLQAVRWAKADILVNYA